MSGKFIFLWSVIILSLIISIAYLGIKEEKHEKYKEMENTLKIAVNKYIDYENKKIPFKITSEELIEKDYLKDLTYENHTCSAIINVNKLLFWNKYKIEFTCSKENE